MMASIFKHVIKIRCYLFSSNVLYLSILFSWLHLANKLLLNHQFFPSQTIAAGISFYTQLSTSVDKHSSKQPWTSLACFAKFPFWHPFRIEYLCIDTLNT